MVLCIHSNICICMCMVDENGFSIENEEGEMLERRGGLQEILSVKKTFNPKANEQINQLVLASTLALRP